MKPVRVNMSCAWPFFMSKLSARYPRPRNVLLTLLEAEYISNMYNARSPCHCWHHVDKSSKCWPAANHSASVTDVDASSPATAADTKVVHNKAAMTKGVRTNMACTAGIHQHLVQTQLKETKWLSIPRNGFGQQSVACDTSRLQFLKSSDFILHK